MVRDMSLTINH